jgi:hypothetical protein
LIITDSAAKARPFKDTDAASFAIQNQGTFTAKTEWTKATKPLQCPPIDMKNSPLTTILLGVLTLSALASVVMCWLYISNTRALRTLQAQAAQVNNNRALINALAADTLEYSKTHPAIDPILESVGLKPGKSAPAATTNKAATK